MTDEVWLANVRVDANAVLDRATEMDFDAVTRISHKRFDCGRHQQRDSSA